MYSQSDIEDAVAAGALAPQQALALREYVASRNQVPTADEEHFRLLLGFNDIFVSYACLMALAAAGALGLLLPVTSMRAGPLGSLPIMAALLVTGGAWGLSFVFLTRGRFALVGILLVMAQGLGAFLSLLFVAFLAISSGPSSPIMQGLLGSVSAAVAALLTFAHWRRFRVPFAVLGYLFFGVIAVIALVGGLLALNPAAATVVPLLMLVFGIALFAYAMSWDAQDTRRYTVRAEVGLWVHWLGSGFISYGVMNLLGVNNGVPSAGLAVAVILVYLLFALVSLVVDRRQLLLAALAPLTTSLGVLLGGGGGYRSPASPFGGYGATPYGGGYPGPFGTPYGSGAVSGGPLMATAATFVAIAIILMMLATLWQPLRRAVLSLLPAQIRARLPAARGSDGGDPVGISRSRP